MNKELFKKFIRGTCTEGEEKHVYAWFSNPANKDSATALMKISWDNMPSEIPQNVKSKQLFIQQVLQRSNDIRADSENVGNRKRNPVWLILKVAASFALIFVLAYALYFNNNQIEEIETITLVEKSNPLGRKSTIKLPDGTTVRLNSNSNIRFQNSFQGDSREVVLEGEAFFEVKKDTTRPFIVRTGEVSTTVLGTSFNINAYGISNVIKVAVISGQVAVSTKGYGSDSTQWVYLAPSEMVTFNRLSRALYTTNFSMEEEVAGWKDGVIIFKNADIKEVSTRLHQWYGLDIVVEDETKWAEERFTGRFENNTLEYVLKAISYTLSIEYELKDDKVILKLK